MEAEKDKGGRPLKFATVEILQQKIDEYFGNCDPHKGKRNVWIQGADAGKGYWTEQEYMTEQNPYTIHGLARALDTTRDTLIDYESGKYDEQGRSEDDNARFSDTVMRAKSRIAEFAEGMLYGKASNGAIFNLKNNYGWVDKTISDVTARTVGDDLNDLDQQKAEVSAAAAEVLNGSPAQK